MLIGICGKAGAGKDTIGDYLIENYGFEKIALADPIKRIVKDVFVLDDHTVYDREAREKNLDKWDGWSVRKLLQYVGTELFREKIDPAIWVKSLWYRVQANPEKNYVVTDIRFPNELQFFKDNSEDGEFTCFKVIRDGYDGSVGLSGHESEKYDLDGDYELSNNSTMKDLYEKIDEIMEEISIPKSETGVDELIVVESFDLSSTTFIEDINVASTIADGEHIVTEFMGGENG
jgi:hypothetical protein